MTNSSSSLKCCFPLNKLKNYKILLKQGEGTFSEVLKAQCTTTGQFFAIKVMKSTFKTLESINSLGEIQSFRKISPHANIVKLQEVLYDEPSGRLALVFELMEMNLYEAIKGRKEHLSEGKVKLLMYQLLKALDHVHSHGIFHRDIKPENILVNKDGDVIKLADLGSCRSITSQQPYTEYISTRWYRPPECLLTDGMYNKKMDVWGVGCVFFEVLTLTPLFPGANELDQIRKIHNVMSGEGIAGLVPNLSHEGVDLLENLLAYDPNNRYSARKALKHRYFRDLRDREAAFVESPVMRVRDALKLKDALKTTERKTTKFAPTSKLLNKERKGLGSHARPVLKPSISTLSEPMGLTGRCMTTQSNRGMRYIEAKRALRRRQEDNYHYHEGNRHSTCSRAANSEHITPPLSNVELILSRLKQQRSLEIRHNGVASALVSYAKPSGYPVLQKLRRSQKSLKPDRGTSLTLKPAPKLH